MSHLRVLSTQDYIYAIRTRNGLFSRVTIGVTMIDLDLYSVKRNVNCIGCIIYTADLVTFLAEAARRLLY